MELIHGDVLDFRRCLVLTMELYTLAARDARFRKITQGWLEISARALERHMEPATTQQVDALIEGVFHPPRPGHHTPAGELTADALGKILGA
ncbi:hypothetical protein [Paeniglutamicibacter psychrophenolicus]|uniref:hypothetical protein n=1 Tax=Paeniglutamicibacter psychrophenolicus TaxID=257454 RepID=UPI00278769ED|nr:hypothetical protein [Paeniglutamicibacter psychrophenolicus]MDQ0093940.1 DNA-binding transcriptional regulator YbjK [Paeniglutamicibacter psychrophenolicus]